MNLLTETLREKMKPDSDEKFIVDFYADWCGPCRLMTPIIEKVSEKLKNEGHQVSIYKFDITKDKQIASELGVRSIPAIKGFIGGENVISKVGVLSEEQLINMANELIQ